jgi:hypothetical protein
VKSLHRFDPDEHATARPREDSLARVDALLAEHGCVLLPGAFDRALVESLRDAYLTFIEAALQRDHARGRVGDQRFMVPVEVKPPFDDPRLSANPLVLPILKRQLGDDCIMNSFGSVVALPGAASQVRHVDHDFLFGFAESVSLPPWAMTLVVPLVDLDHSTGTTAVFEGSHRREALADEGRQPSLPWARMGDGFLMDYRLWHFGTMNDGTRLRPILYLVYSRPWFLDEHNFYALSPLTVTDAVFAALPAELRALFGPSRTPSVVVVE